MRKRLLRQLKLLGGCRRQHAEERTAVGDEPGVLTVDLRAHHRSQSAHGHRDVRKAGDLAGLSVCCGYTESDGKQRAPRKWLRHPGHSAQLPLPLKSRARRLDWHARGMFAEQLLELRLYLAPSCLGRRRPPMSTALELFHASVGDRILL